MRRAVPVLIPVASFVVNLAAFWLETSANGVGAGVDVALAFIPLSIACAIVGSLMWVRRAGGVLAGLFIFVGFQIPVVGVLQAYADAGATYGWAGTAWVAWLFQASIGLSAAFYLIIQLFPTGQPLSARWRLLVWLTLASGVFSFMVPALGRIPEYTANFPTLPHPVGLLSAGLARALDGLSGLLTPAVFALSAVEMILRYRRSVGDERVQMKWFTAAAALAATGLIIAVILVPNPVIAFVLFGPFVPIAAGIAILKYHLYDIDVVISKTVVFALLAAFITAVYVAVVVGVGSLSGSSHNPALSIAATALVAVLFEPVRVRAQRLANRLVYGERATPYEVMAGFSVRVSETLSVDEVLPGMAEAAGRGVGGAEAVARVSLPGGETREALWRREGFEGRLGEPASLPILHQGQPVGEVSVVKPVNEPISQTEHRLLADLASQAGLAMHNVRLSEELAIRLRELEVQTQAIRTSRERLVTARNAQRRGLQRDLQEGPERQLRAIGVALGTAIESADLDPLLEEANATLEGLRDLARGIFPPLLADKGVIAALEAHIRKVAARATIEAGPDFVDTRFDDDSEACVYFCCLQAIQNVIRHAGNAPCTVTLSCDDEHIAFQIRDEGPGFDVPSTPRGMGMDIMQDRVDAFDGELHVTSQPGAGTTVAVRIPFAVREAVA